MTAKRTKRPRCYLVYALAPDGTTMRKANDGINAMVGDQTLPLVVFHDHFLDRPGGVAVFDVTAPEQVALIEDAAGRHLADWRIDIRPFIFSYSASAFDEQIAYTLKTYRGKDWETIRHEKRPSYGNPSREAQTGEEE